MYPRSGFRSGGTSAKTTLLETTLLRTPGLRLRMEFGEGDAMKQKSVKKSAFSLNEGMAFSE